MPVQATKYREELIDISADELLSALSSNDPKKNAHKLISESRGYVANFAELPSFNEGFISAIEKRRSNQLPITLHASPFTVVADSHMHVKGTGDHAAVYVYVDFANDSPEALQSKLEMLKSSYTQLSKLINNLNAEIKKAPKQEKVSQKERQLQEQKTKQLEETIKTLEFSIKSMEKAGLDTTLNKQQLQDLKKQFKELKATSKNQKSHVNNPISIPQMSAEQIKTIQDAQNKMMADMLSGNNQLAGNSQLAALKAAQLKDAIEKMQQALQTPGISEADAAKLKEGIQKMQEMLIVVQAEIEKVDKKGY